MLGVGRLRSLLRKSVPISGQLTQSTPVVSSAVLRDQLATHSPAIMLKSQLTPT